MALPNGSEVTYTLYDKVTSSYLHGYSFIGCAQYPDKGFDSFDKAYNARRKIMEHHNLNRFKCDIIIIKISKVWDIVEGNI